MNRHRHRSHQPGPQHPGSPHGGDPYWKRAHRDWRFWVAVMLMLLAMTFFVMTDNLALLPGRRAPSPGVVAR